MSKFKSRRARCQGDIFPAPDRGTIQAAVENLFFSNRAHFVITRADRKQPLWQKWNQRRPGIDAVMKAYDSGYRIGIIPNSISMVVIDVDAGDPDAIIEIAPPLLSLPTDKPGRAHLYYRAGPGARNIQGRELTLHGARLTVDVLYRRLTIIYGWNLPAVAAAAAGGTGGDFPSGLFDDSETNRARLKYNRRRAALEDTLHPVKGRAIGTGRNNTIFWNAWSMAKHDYPAGRLSKAELVHYCFSLNERFSDTLDAEEVDKIAGSIWKFLTENFQTPPAAPRPDNRKLSRKGQAAAERTFRLKQGARARRRAKAAHVAAAPKIITAEAMRAAGATVAAVAGELDVSPRTVLRWTDLPDTLHPRPRREAILEAHANGKSGKEIAAALGVNPATVSRVITAARPSKADRNARILAAHANGKSGKEIAAALGVNPATVSRVITAPTLSPAPKKTRP